jgi:hypothetical protein
LAERGVEAFEADALEVPNVRVGDALEDEEDVRIVAETIERVKYSEFEVWEDLELASKVVFIWEGIADGGTVPHNMKKTCVSKESRFVAGETFSVISMSDLCSKCSSRK